MSSFLRRANRDLYFASRMAGDLNAYQRRGLGGLLIRLGKRRIHRAEIKAAKRIGAW